MGVFIGMDEAGYGPNLGPLVITATVWEVPGDAANFDWWTALSPLATDAPSKDDDRLHVGDSKAVYSPAKGLAALERSVVALLAAAGARPDGFRELCECLVGPDAHDMHDEPWFAGRDGSVPENGNGTDRERLANRAIGELERAGVRLLAVRSDVVSPRRFNEETRTAGNKSAALSSLSIRLLGRVWDPGTTEPTFVVADKHGGRNRYDDVLAEILDGAMALRLDEGRERSRYRVEATEIRFQTKAEAWFPVALASMVSKYVRERAMGLFNDFWREHVPELKPTKGYPQDAKRFRADVDEARRRLGIEDDVFWRER